MKQLTTSGSQELSRLRPWNFSFPFSFSAPAHSHIPCLLRRSRRRFRSYSGGELFYSQVNALLKRDLNTRFENKVNHSKKCKYVPENRLRFSSYKRRGSYFNQKNKAECNVKNVFAHWDGSLLENTTWSLITSGLHFFLAGCLCSSIFH